LGIEAWNEIVKCNSFSSEISMNAITIDDAKHDLDAVVGKVITDSEPTFVSTGNGQGVVLVPVEEFNAWQETVYLLRSPANAEHLRRSIAEVEAGQVSVRELIDP
jgi:antitoxin YefM